VGLRVIALTAFVLLCSAATFANGIDVSNHQGSKIDWPQVAGAGITFSFLKASEGTTFTDATYALNRSGANAAAIPIGAYHFARPAGTNDVTLTASGIAQADHFVDIAQPRGGDLPPVLDLETTGGLNVTNLVKWTQAWVTEVAARTGVQPLVYTSPAFWKKSLGDTTTFALAGNKLWVAHWTSASGPTVPASNWGGLGWTFWQWSNCQKIPGITTGCVDGDRAIAVTTIPALPSGSPSSATAPTILGTPRAGVKLAALPGTWSGGKPVTFAYQWLVCNGACTAIPGATLETFTPTTTQVGHTLEVSVTATAKGGTALATSAPSAVVAAPNGALPPAVLAPPAVSGTPQVGQTLTTSTGTWSGSPTSYAYQWQRCDATGVCTAITGATGTAYLLTPGDIGATIEIVVTATNTVGSQSATSAPTAAVAAAPVPPPTPDSSTAQPGQAGAVATSDASATVTWQPGAVPDGTVVSLSGTSAQLTLALTPPIQPLPWPVDIAYATPRTAQQVVGYSTDEKIWSAVAPLTSATLPAGLLAGAFEGHLLTRKAGSFKLFVANAWGDPRKVSRFAPRLRRVGAIKVKRLRSGAFVVSTRLSAPSQVLVLPTRRRLLQPGQFPVTVRVPKTKRSVVITAVDPYGRRASFTLSFRAPQSP
jgi:GH25 family lysozyme M1 (1,4-beta-N-acetylmuramidase)